MPVSFSGESVDRQQACVHLSESTATIRLVGSLLIHCGPVEARASTGHAFVHLEAPMDRRWEQITVALIWSVKIWSAAVNKLWGSSVDGY